MVVRKDDTMKKKLTKIVRLFLFAVLLCACQKQPIENVVISKNEQNLNTSILQEADPHVEQNVKYTDLFTSTDGSIQYSLNIDQTFPAVAMPVVEVIPHYLTGEDVKRVAQILLEDAQFFEQEPLYAPRYSKAQLQDKIYFLSQYANSESLEQLYGVDPVMNSSELDNIKWYINHYTKQLETAPEEDPHIPCEWSFKEEDNYFKDISEENRVICSTAEKGNITYSLIAVTRNEEDFKLNGITIDLGSGVDLTTTEKAIYRSKLCRTEEPTEEQILAVKTKSQELLDRMDLGDWLVVDAYSETAYCGDIPEYTIRVEATPVLAGIPALGGQSINNLTGTHTYVSNYYMTYAYFLFSANGELVFFGMDSPITIKNIINANVATLSMDSLLNRLKTHLSLTEIEAGYGIPGGFYELYRSYAGEELECRVELCELNYGLGRIRVRDSEESYYYLPVLSCKGKAEYYGKDSGRFYTSSSEYGDEVSALVWINAVDGTIVEG